MTHDNEVCEIEAFTQCVCVCARTYIHTYTSMYRFFLRFRRAPRTLHSDANQGAHKHKNKEIVKREEGEGREER